MPLKQLLATNVPLDCFFLQSIGINTFWYIPNQYISISRALIGYSSLGYPVISTGLQNVMDTRVRNHLSSRVLSYDFQQSNYANMIITTGFQVVFIKSQNKTNPLDESMETSQQVSLLPSLGFKETFTTASDPLRHLPSYYP